MRSFILATSLAIGLGAFAVPTASAAPVSGTAILDAAQAQTLIEEVQRRSRRRCTVTRIHRPSTRVRRIERCRHR